MKPVKQTSVSVGSLVIIPRYTEKPSVRRTRSPVKILRLYQVRNPITNRIAGI